MRGAAVEGQLLDRSVGGVEDRAARGLVHAAAFHAHQAILDQVEAADSMCLAERVQPSQQRRRRQRLAVDRDRVAALELDRDFFGVWARSAVGGAE